MRRKIEPDPFSPASAPNKRTAEVAERLEALGCDSIQGMARIAMDTSAAAELRGRMYSELAQYVAPKRKAVGHSAADGGTFTTSWLDNDVRSMSTPKLVDLMLQRIAAGEYPADDVPHLMEILRAQIIETSNLAGADGRGSPQLDNA